MIEALPDKRLVFGEGSLNACLVIIGEAPGRKEEESGHPFVGRAGQLLNQLLAKATLQRSDIWITNVIKWRPTRGNSNRTPSLSEIKTELCWLQCELDVLHPEVIVCLGNSAARALLNRSFNMVRQRGHWYQGPGGTLITATFHPGYLLRQKANLQEQVVQDLREAKIRCLERIGKVVEERS